MEGKRSESCRREGASKGMREGGTREGRYKGGR